MTGVGLHVDITTARFRAHRMHTVNLIATDAYSVVYVSVSMCVCLSVCLLVTAINCAETAEPIEMPTEV